jgi:hypothetical protein
MLSVAFQCCSDCRGTRGVSTTKKKKVQWHGLQETIEKEEEEDLEAKLAEAISSVPEMDDEEEVSG